MSTKPYAVLRAIFMDGLRIEPGTAVQLTAQQAIELRATGRVGAEVQAADVPSAAEPPQPARRQKAPPNER